MKLGQDVFRGVFSLSGSILYVQYTAHTLCWFALFFLNTVYQLLQLFGFELLLRMADQALVVYFMIIPWHMPGETEGSHGKSSSDIFGTSFEALIGYLYNTCTQNPNIPMLGEEVLYAYLPPPPKVFIKQYIRNFTYFVHIWTDISGSKIYRRQKFISLIGFKLGIYFLKMELSCRNISE